MITAQELYLLGWMLVAYILGRYHQACVHHDRSKSAERAAREKQP